MSRIEDCCAALAISQFPGQIDVSPGSPDTPGKRLYEDCIRNPHNYTYRGVPCDAEEQAEAAKNFKYTGTPVTEFFMAIAVVSSLTFLLPKKWVVWFPLIILLAYTARNPEGINGAVDYLTSLLGRKTP